LGFVDSKNLLDGFEFKEQAVFDKEVEARNGSSKVWPLYSINTVFWFAADNCRRNNSRVRHLS
jgi:hypothetical protein